MTKRFFGAVALKFEPKMTVIIKNLAQKVDFWAKCCSNQDCCSICADTVIDFKIQNLSNIFNSDYSYNIEMSIWNLIIVRNNQGIHIGVEIIRFQFGI